MGMPPISQSSFGAPSMPSADRPSRGTGRATSATLTAARPKPKLKKVLPEVWKLVKPRRWLLAGSFCLMIVNRASGLILPASTRYLIDNVMDKHQLDLLPMIVGVVVTATILQGITSFTLTQLLSKAGQRLIAELRTKVQAHIGRLPVAFYDENRTGTLVARIMTDVEGVRNLIGTGVVDFCRRRPHRRLRLLLSHRALSVKMTLLTFVILLLFGLILQRAFKTIRPIFRERSKINAEVTGRLTESLGGVRVVKGYHAEAERGQRLRGRCPAPARQRHLVPHRAVVHVARLHRRPRARRRARHVPRRPPGRRRTPHHGRLRDLRHVPRLHDRAHRPARLDRHPAHRSSRRP